MIDLETMQERMNEEIAAKERRAEQEIIANQQKKLDAGLSFLLQKRVDKDELMIMELTKGVSRIKQFLEKHKGYVITDADKSSLHQWLQQIPCPMRKAEKQDFENINGNYWQQIAKFVGPDLATQWFNEIC